MRAHMVGETGRHRGSHDRIEVWDAGRGESYVYTTSRRFTQNLAHRFHLAAEYVRNGRVTAWQFRIPKQMVMLLKRAFRRMARKPEQTS